MTSSHSLSPVADSRSASLRPPRRRRNASNRSTLTSSSSSSSSSSPPPSHFMIQTPFHPSSSSVPFSWERTPGIPKTPSHKSLYTRPLPLPPPLRSDSFTRKLAAADPFAAALAECAKDKPAPAVLWMPHPAPAPAIQGPRRWSIADRIGFGLGFLDLYGSCKTSCSVSDSTIQIPRATQRVGSYRRVI